YENKDAFRSIFEDILPIPAYRRLAIDSMLRSVPSDLYNEYASLFGATFVIQDSNNGGGRGTFIIKSPADILKSQNILRQEKRSEMLIVSQFIKGIERSIQVCITAEGAVTGPLQQQLVRNPDLQNVD